MIRVAVCDDDKKIRETIRQYLESKGKRLKNESISISIYESGDDFLYAVEQGTYFHITFMDIEINDKNGIDIGHLLRSRSGGDDMVIIYISSHQSYFEPLAEVGSFRFLRKPLNMDALDKVFSRALAFAYRLKIVTDRENLFHYHVGASKEAVKVGDIVYMQTDKQLLEIYTWDRKTGSIVYLEKIYSSIARAMKQLPENFVQCSRSHVTNLDYVVKLRYVDLTLNDKDSTILPIGRTHVEKVKKAYFERRGM